MAEIFPEMSLREDNDADHKAALLTTGQWGRSAAGCLILARSTGRFLVAHRSFFVLQPNTWGTWGGAIDAGEDPAEAVRREVREESGFGGAVQTIPLYIFRKKSFSYHNFLALVDEEFKPRLNWENRGARWVDYGDWPNRLHYGLQGLLEDPQSAKIMQGEAAKAKAAALPEGN